MPCQKSPDNELLELGEKELCAVPQAFSGGQQRVSRWAAFCTYVDGAFVLFLTALLFQHSGCKCGITIGWNPELELTCWWVVNQEPTIVSSAPQPNVQQGTITFYLTSEFMSVPLLVYYTVNSRNVPFWCLKSVDHQPVLVTSTVCIFSQATYKTRTERLTALDHHYQGGLPQL